MGASDEISDPAILGCLESCARLLQVVQAVTPAQYCTTWKGHNGIGPHMRHCVEHLTALRAGLGSGSVQYDARDRDRHLEQDPQACAAAIQDVIQWLAGIESGQLDQRLVTVQIPQVDAPPTHSESSLRRELLFVTSHTIHHLAVVSMLAEIHEISMPERLGLAYSTQAYEREQAARPEGASAATP